MFITKRIKALEDQVAALQHTLDEKTQATNYDSWNGTRTSYDMNGLLKWISKLDGTVRTLQSSVETGKKAARGQGSASALSVEVKIADLPEVKTILAEAADKIAALKRQLEARQAGGESGKHGFSITGSVAGNQENRE